MKVLMLASSFAPATGGAEKYMYNLAAGVAAVGHEVTVGTDGSLLEASPADELVDGFRVVRTSDYLTGLERTDRLRWRQAQYGVVDELGQAMDAKPDLVHANSHEALLIGAQIALTHDVPLVASLHEVTPSGSPYGLGRLRLSYEVLPVAAVIAGSRFYYERARTAGLNESRLHHIYNSVPIPEVSATDRSLGRRRLGLSEGQSLIVYPARLHPRKDQLTMIAAFELVARQIPDAVLMLAGRSCEDDYTRRIYQAAAATACADRIKIEQDLSDASMDSVFRAADLVAMSSLQEGLGLAAVEAMSYRKPLVVTDVDGLREVVEDDLNGLLVAAEDPVALANAMTRELTESGLAERHAAAGRQLAVQRFSSRSMVDATVAVYRHVLAEHRPRSGSRWLAESAG